MTPTFNTPEGRVAPTWGLDQAQDRGGVAVLDDQGVVVFAGCAADAQQFMCDHGYREHANAEIVENRGYTVGFDPF